MSTGWIFYPPPPIAQRPPKIVPTLPAGVDNPPFGLTTRRAILDKIRDSWNIPPVAVQSKQSLKSFYNPQWDVLDTPPPLNRTAQINLILNNWNLYLELLQGGATRLYEQRRRRSNPGLFPVPDNPPPL